MLLLSLSLWLSVSLCVCGPLLDSLFSIQLDCSEPRFWFGWQSSFVLTLSCPGSLLARFAGLTQWPTALDGLYRLAKISCPTMLQTALTMEQSTSGNFFASSLILMALPQKACIVSPLAVRLDTLCLKLCQSVIKIVFLPPPPPPPPFTNLTDKYLSNRPCACLSDLLATPLPHNFTSQPPWILHR